MLAVIYLLEAVCQGYSSSLKITVDILFVMLPRTNPVKTSPYIALNT